MMNKLSLDFSAEETFNDPEEDLADPFANSDNKPLGPDAAK